MSNQDALNNLAILGEILVDVSKFHIMPKEAIYQIRELDISSIYEAMSKQIKLLEELKVIFNRHSLRLDNMREWYNLQVLESRVLNDIEKLIKDVL